ncbi:MAG: hypothetical protein ACRYFS_08980, partial [Janthinobacterium lividum]
GKAIASRNATTHGVFARDIVLPSLGEDPDGYQQVQDELIAHLRPANLLERHYVEKIAAASWRLRRLHRWQAQLFEDETLTEDARLDKLDKVLRHETALQRQIDTSVRMLAKDVPFLYARRARTHALEMTQICERECLDDAEIEQGVSMEASNRLYQIRKSTTQVVNELSVAAVDTVPRDLAADNSENCQNEPAAPKPSYRTLPREETNVVEDADDSDADDSSAPSHSDRWEHTPPDQPFRVGSCRRGYLNGVCCRPSAT